MPISQVRVTTSRSIASCWYVVVVSRTSQGCAITSYVAHSIRLVSMVVCSVALSTVLSVLSQVRQLLQQRVRSSLPLAWSDRSVMRPLRLQCRLDLAS